MSGELDGHVLGRLIQTRPRQQHEAAEALALLSETEGIIKVLSSITLLLYFSQIPQCQ